MFATFLHELKAAGVPVTLREYLTLMEAMEKDIAGRRVEDFYYLSRATLVKDERNLDAFDRVFGHVFKGLALIDEAIGPRSRPNGSRSSRRNISPMKRRSRLRRLAVSKSFSKRCGSGSPNSAAATRAAANGSALREPRRSALMAIIPKACASARTATAISAR